MSALGHKRTFAVQNSMSALPPKADMCSALAHVCFVPIADIRPSSAFAVLNSTRPNLGSIPTRPYACLRGILSSGRGDRGCCVRSRLPNVRVAIPSIAPEPHELRRSGRAIRESAVTLEGSVMSAKCQKRRKRPPCGGLSAWCQPAALNRRTPGHRHQPIAGPALLHKSQGREREVKALHHHFLACGHIVKFFPRFDRLLPVRVEHELPVRIACEQ